MPQEIRLSTRVGGSLAWSTSEEGGGGGGGGPAWLGWGGENIEGKQGYRASMTGRGGDCQWSSMCAPQWQVHTQHSQKTTPCAAPPLYREDSGSSRTPAQAYDDRPARARGSYTGNDDDPPTLPDPVAAPKAAPNQAPAPAAGADSVLIRCFTHCWVGSGAGVPGLGSATMTICICILFVERQTGIWPGFPNQTDKAADKERCQKIWIRSCSFEPLVCCCAVPSF